MFATADAHVTGGTADRPPRLRLERVVDAGLPPRIGPWRHGGGYDGNDRRRDFRDLDWRQLDVHVRKSYGCHSSPVRGISHRQRAFTRSGDAHGSSGEGDSFQCGI